MKFIRMISKSRVGKGDFTPRPLTFQDEKIPVQVYDITKQLGNSEPTKNIARLWPHTL
ncbi:hypothetical protein JM83_3152 [Gillisia sp. Hel_I_86]|nr:hypothetical protein JM83_3152 [Gillisia sp. Hel_I_86]